MIFKSEKKYRIKRYRCWFPITLSNGDAAWLEKVVSCQRYYEPRPWGNGGWKDIHVRLASDEPMEQEEVWENYNEGL